MPRNLFRSILCLLSLQVPLYAVISTHPRLLLTQADLSSVAINLKKGGVYENDFTLFVRNTTYINGAVPHALDPSSCHQILNKVMKNAFLYLLFSKSELAECPSCHGGMDKNSYLANMRPEIVFLLNATTTRALQANKNMESIGYTIKALSLALDWAYVDVPAESRLTGQIRSTLMDWGKWLTSEERYYGSVFENHAPWDTKALAYLSIAAGDDALLTNKRKKVQQSRIPKKRNKTASGEVYMNAKPFLEQILEATNYVADPDGGWHEGPSYFMLKELPELIEYTELICVHNDNETYNKELFTKPVFRKAGLFLWQYSTPDGFFMKKGDTGQKSCRPVELFRPDGYSYGDIHNIGAGYIATYHLRRLYHRLRTYPECQAEAAVLNSFLNYYCGDEINRELAHEARINLLYKFIWDRPASSSAKITSATPLGGSHYNPQTATLVSRHGSHTDPLSTIVRFDAMPHFFSSHQHFSNGHFVIFKKGNLAIDGGRYIAGDDPPRIHYSEHFYRASFAHNVVLFGDSAQIGQDKFERAPDQAPYTLSQIKSFREGSIDEAGLSVFISNSAVDKNPPFSPAVMQIELKDVYSAVALTSYTRTLVHLVPTAYDSENKRDFIIVYDNIKLADNSPQKATWQMHFRDNGLSAIFNKSLFQVQRRETIPAGWQFKGFGAQYDGVLTIKTLLPAVCEYRMEPVSQPDSLCASCWNGRIMEESNRILQIPSSAKQEHEFLTILMPSLQTDKIAAQAALYQLDQSLSLVQHASAGQTVCIRADQLHRYSTPEADAPALFLSFACNSRTYAYEVSASQAASVTEHIVTGLPAASYRVTISDQWGALAKLSASARTSRGSDAAGVLIFPYYQSGEARGYTVNITRE